MQIRLKNRFHIHCIELSESKQQPQDESEVETT